MTGVNYSGLLTLGSDSSIVANAGNINLTNAGTITGATFDLTLGGTGNGSISSIIGTTTGALTKVDSGTWMLSGASTYAGDTTISAGTLKLGAANAIPDGAGKGNAVIVTGTFDLNGFSDTINGLSGAGTVDNTAAATTSTLTVGGNNQDEHVLRRDPEHRRRTLALAKTGTGMLTLSGANTYDGVTTITQGTLVAANDNGAG